MKLVVLTLFYIFICVIAQNDLSEFLKQNKEELSSVLKHFRTCKKGCRNEAKNCAPKCLAAIHAKQVKDDDTEETVLHSILGDIAQNKFCKPVYCKDYCKVCFFLFKIVTFESWVMKTMRKVAKHANVLLMCIALAPMLMLSLIKVVWILSKVMKVSVPVFSMCFYQKKFLKIKIVLIQSD